MLYSVIYFSVAFSGAIFSSMSGGGSSLIDLPIWLSLGISLPMAVAIEKINAVFWTLPASFNYLKKQKINWAFLFCFSAIGVVGTYFGFLLLTSVNPLIMKRVIGVFIMAVVIYMYFRKNIGLSEKPEAAKRFKLLSYLVAFPMGVYEGILGSGNGIFFSILTIHTRGFDLSKALGYYFAIAFFWTSFAAVLLIQKGYFDPYISVPAILGSVIGSYLGSRLAKKRGNKFIKYLFIGIGVLLSLKLLLNL